jgi:heme/copper-type cytochrome/quinol oxidase subunit 4
LAALVVGVGLALATVVLFMFSVALEVLPFWVVEEQRLPTVMETQAAPMVVVVADRRVLSLLALAVPVPPV